MSTKPRAAFMGSPDFAVPSLRATAAHTDLVLVVSQPDRPAGRGAVELVHACGDNLYRCLQAGNRPAVEVGRLGGGVRPGRAVNARGVRVEHPE